MARPPCHPDRSRPYGNDALTCLDTALRPLPPDARLCKTIISSAETTAAAIGLAVPRVLRSSEMDISGSGWHRVLDLVSEVGGTGYVTGHGARNYLDHRAFEDAGIAVHYMRYDPTPWAQQFEPFTPYVTGLDLIAARPPGARAAHLNPATTPWQDFVNQQSR